MVKVLHDFLLTSPKRCCRLSISPVRRHEYPPGNLEKSSKDSEETGCYVTTSNISIGHVHEILIDGELNKPVEIFRNEETSLSFNSQDYSTISDWSSETPESNKTYTVDVESPGPTSVPNLFTELISAVQKRELRISGIDTLSSTKETPVLKEEMKTEVSKESSAFLSFSSKTCNNHESRQNLFAELISAAKKRESRISDKINSSEKTEENTVDISTESAAFLSFNTSSQYESCDGLELPTNG